MIDKKQSLTFRVCVLLIWVMAGTLTSSAVSIGESGEPVAEQTGAAGTVGSEAALEAVATLEALAEVDEIKIDLPKIQELAERIDDQESGISVLNSDRVGPDEIRNGDVVVFGGIGEVEGRVNGSVVVFGGSAKVSGLVNGDVVVFGGSANIESTAKVNGDVVVIGGVLNREDGSMVEGDVVVLGGGNLSPGDELITPDLGMITRGFHLTAIMTWLVLGFIITLLFTRPVENTVKYAIDRPIQSLLSGFLFHVASLLICVILTVILIGIPLAFLGAIIWLLISVFGTVVGFVLMGRLVWDKFRKGYANILLILMTGILIMGIIRFVPFLIGWTIWQLWGMAGIGATVLSRFGSNKPWFGQKRAQGTLQMPPVPEDLP